MNPYQPLTATVANGGTNVLQTLQDQQKAAASIPVIRSNPVDTTQQIGPQSLAFQRITVPAGAIFPLVIKGNYVYVEGLTSVSDTPANAPLYLKADTQQYPVPLFEGNRAIRFTQPFSNVQLDNTGNTVDVAIYFWIGFGDVRRDSTSDKYRTFSTLTSVAGATYAANKVVGANPVTFTFAVNGFTSSANITKATLVKSTNATANANFSLFLFGVKPTAVADNANFTFLPTGVTNAVDYLGVIQFSSFVAGAAGSNSVCDVAGFSIAMTSPGLDLSSNPSGTVYGILVANAAYTAAAGEVFSIKLFGEG